jgi:hypothetical protein
MFYYETDIIINPNPNIISDIDTECLINSILLWLKFLFLSILSNNDSNIIPKNIPNKMDSDAIV